jgi:ribosomal protein S18 acetylase RimI-like enzyme
VWFREATADDAAAIAHVHVESWRTTYRGAIPDAYLDGLSHAEHTRLWTAWLTEARAGTFVYLALNERRRTVVGFAMGGPARDGDLGFAGELYAIYLLAHAQGQGIGRRLMCLVAERLASRDTYSLLAWTLKDGAACRFYEALGGTVVRTRQETIGGALLEQVAYGWTDSAILRRGTDRRP